MSKSNSIGALYRTPVNMASTEPNCGIVCGPSMTQQHFKDECDINNIVDSYGKGAHCVGEINVNSKEPVYMDCTTSVGLKDSLIIVDNANALFNELSLNVRREFDYNPVNLLEFVENPANRERAIELGLIAPVAPASGAEVLPQPTSETSVSEAGSASE